MRDGGKERLYLEVFLIPEKLVNLTLVEEGSQVDLDIVKSETELGSVGRKKITNLTVTLEQILILIHNPEYNVLKVAGYPAGNQHTLESMLPSFLENYKATYVIDNETNKVIYI